MKRRLSAVLAGSSLLVLSSTLPVQAQQASAQSAAAMVGEEIIVTARRREENLQDVPISITVLNDEELANNNIISAKDIATYTPGLTTNNRYGADATTWTVRGFTQELRTTATVGTYFADVVAPRGSGATPGGDGAGPGALFDLANVQVLKGPQGTLFGRNSTGGAVLLVPRKPTDRVEGYVEGSVGDYGMWRTQGAVNFPAGEKARFRIGADHNEREGYLKNAGLLGPKAMGNVNYSAIRASMVLDITPDIENYTIVTWSNSKNNGVIPKLTQCFTTSPYTGAAIGAGAFTCAQIAREAPLGFWSVSNPLPDTRSQLKQKQVINTTTWTVSDDLTVKNIFSYGEMRGHTNLDLFGYYRPVTVAPGSEVTGNQVQPFNTTHSLPGGYSQAQSSLVEELQFQGNALNGRMVWQGGLYLEINDPLGASGIQSTTQTPCADVAAINCLPGQNANSIGRLAWQTTSNEFRGKAAYFQASYDLNEKFKITGGLRYTWDSVHSQFQITALRLYSAPVTSVVNGQTVVFPAGNFFYCQNDVQFGQPGSATNAFRPLDQRFTACREDHKVKSKAPTWVIGLDYKPMDNLLLYAKWSRGYRQGGVASFAADKLQDFRAEKVDTYEIGAKTDWRGTLPGYFNVAGFYNNFRDQQLQIGLSCNPVSLCAQTTAIVNAGKSSLYGLEAEVGVVPFEGMRLEASYAYLHTKVKEILDLRAIVTSLGLPFNDIRPVPLGSPIPNAMPHKLTFAANYTLPMPDSAGKVTVGGTLVYQSRYRAVSDPFIQDATATPILPYRYATEFGILPSATILNLNLNWDRFMGLDAVSAAFFVTNVTNAKVYLHANVQAAQGFVSNIIGEPRMWGFRLRYRFGE